MDADRLWWLRLVSFLTHGFAIYGSGLAFRSATFKCGERGGTSFGAGAAVDRSKFPLSRWSQGLIELPNVKLILPFSQKSRSHPTTRHAGLKVALYL